MSLRVWPSPDRLIVLAEVLTVAWCLYAAAFWIDLFEMRVPRLWIVPLIDKLLKAGIAVTLAWAVQRRTPWAFWGVVIFAAYMGVPTLDHVYSVVSLWASGPQARSQAWGALFHVMMGGAQLVALVLGLKQLLPKRAAA